MLKEYISNGFTELKDAWDFAPRSYKAVTIVGGCAVAIYSASILSSIFDNHVGECNQYLNTKEGSAAIMQAVQNNKSSLKLPNGRECSFR